MGRECFPQHQFGFPLKPQLQKAMKAPPERHVMNISTNKLNIGPISSLLLLLVVKHMARHKG